MTSQIQEFIRKDKESIEAPTIQTLYYLKCFQTFVANPKKKSQSWNWSAFGFGAFWLFYRRMYLYGGIGIALTMFVPIILDSFQLSSFERALPIVIGVTIGLVGNGLYYDFAEKEINQGITRGGTTSVVPILVLALLIILYGMRGYFGF
jgi:hypothetical protein